MTVCTTCVSVAALLFQLLSHFLPNDSLLTDGLGWWHWGATNAGADSPFVPWLETLALLSDLGSLAMWSDYNTNKRRSNRQSAEAAKYLSRGLTICSVALKGCGCWVLFCWPRPGMFWCCVSSGTSLIFNLLSVCCSLAEE